MLHHLQEASQQAALCEGGGGDGAVRDQPADDLHGLPPPARPLDHQEAADRIQAACRGGGGATILTKH